MLSLLVIRLLCAAAIAMSVKGMSRIRNFHKGWSPWFPTFSITWQGPFNPRRAVHSRRQLVETLGSRDCGWQFFLLAWLGADIPEENAKKSVRWIIGGAYIPNMDPLLCLEPCQKLAVVHGGGGWSKSIGPSWRIGNSTSLIHTTYVTLLRN